MILLCIAESFVTEIKIILMIWITKRIHQKSKLKNMLRNVNRFGCINNALLIYSVLIDKVQ